MEKKRVLLIQSKIKHYRVPVFNELAKHVDLTVMYDSGDLPQGITFETIKVETKSIKYFRKIHKCNILSFANKFDATIMTLDPSYLTTHLLAHFYKKPLIYWGIGVAAARDMRYDGCQKTANVLRKLINKADATVFYCDYPVKKYSELGISKNKLFVANNTVEVLPIEHQDKKEIMFIGSLYKAKKIFELLECYKNAYSKNNSVPDLVIIGDGEEYQAIEKWISEYQLNDKITLTGAIFDDKILSNYFAKALVCISPDQAGLSVLKSLGYGVPFVAHKDAITGGERFNIINNETGILIDNFNEIENIILECTENKEKYLEMGQKSYNYYCNNRTVENMVKGFVDAVNYVTVEK